MSVLLAVCAAAGANALSNPFSRFFNQHQDIIEIGSNRVSEYLHQIFSGNTETGGIAEFGDVAAAWEQLTAEYGIDALERARKTYEAKTNSRTAT